MPGPLPAPFCTTGGLVLVTIVAITAWHLGFKISLHHVIPGSARHRKFIRSVIDHRQHAGEVVVRWRRSRYPLERRCFPWIVIFNFLAFEDAPHDVVVEQKLRAYRD